jgi:kynureninase
MHDDTIAAAVGALGEAPLTEDSLRAHIFPLFSRVLKQGAERGEIYLANHSLGRPVDRTAEDVARGVDLWYREMDGAWEDWVAEINTFRRGIARLIGLARDDAVVPKAAAGQGLRAVLNALPAAVPSVVATTGEFDSIDFALKTYAHKGRARVSWARPDGDGLFHADDVIARITDQTDLVVVSHAIFATGQLVEGIDRIVAAAGRHGALVLLDTYHTAGVMPVGFDALGVDFAIGGSYKYTRGGPGACWLAVAPRHLRGEGEPPADGLFTLDTGWFAKRGTFAYERTPTPELSAGGDAWMESTPAVLAAYHAKAGLELTLGIGVDRLRAYNTGQQARLASALREHGVEPRLIEPRGAFLLVPHLDASAVSRRLKTLGVNTDARPCPSGRTRHIRLCPDILTTAEEIDRAAALVARALSEF